MKITKYLSCLFLAGTLASCGEDFLNDMPSGTATGDQIADQASKDPEKILASQISGCYTNWNLNHAMGTSDINSHQDTGFGGIMLLSDIMSNDISLVMAGDPWHYDHELDYYAEQYVRSRWPWAFFYTVISSANDVIAVVDEENTTESGRHILGQALAFRGISYAYLAQFYQKTYADGDNKSLPCVPIRLTDKEAGGVDGRATVEQVYQRAETDLLRAVELLEGYKRPDKTTIDRQVAQGLLSRVYLVMNRWQDAADMANAARQGYTLNTIEEVQECNYQNLSDKEVMWGFDVIESNKQIFASWASWRSVDGPGYAGYEVGAYQLIDARLYNSIPEDDVRHYQFIAPDDNVSIAGNEIPAYANMKFPFVSQWLGDVVYMRVAELYLTEAEALFRAGNASGANAVMAEFMPNRVLDWTPSVGGFNAETIYLQRRAELWGEGFGYFDCRRLKQDLVRNYEGTNESASMQKNIPYNSYQWTYQLPLSEIRDNDAISPEDQNPLE